MKLRSPPYHFVRDPKMVGLYVTAILLLATAAHAGELRIVDGDSIVLDGERIRLSGIDAPELLAGCDAERMLAELATDALAEALRGAEVSVEREGRDRYGRTLATVLSDGRDVGEAMIAAGVAVPWAGRRHSWCREESR